MAQWNRWLSFTCFIQRFFFSLLTDRTLVMNRLNFKFTRSTLLKDRKEEHVSLTVEFLFRRQKGILFSFFTLGQRFRQVQCEKPPPPPFFIVNDFGLLVRKCLP